MTSYEFKVLAVEIEQLKYKVQCLANRTVTNPPPPAGCNAITIITQPQPLVLNVGDSDDLSVAVTGDTPIVYQWRYNGLEISGATADTYSITDATLQDAGNYSVTISNPCGIVNSDTVGVTVTQNQVLFRAYWGWSDAALTTSTQILALQGNALFTSGHDTIADYRANDQPKYLIMAEPLTEPQKTKWYGTDLNQGSIGGDSDLFGMPVAIGSFRVYTSAFKTQQQDTPIQFKVS